MIMYVDYLETLGGNYEVECSMNIFEGRLLRLTIIIKCPEYRILKVNKINS